jgi:SAM-dependent methyltransferase
MTVHPEFKDYFSADSSAYAEFRPRYPEALFDWLSSLCPGHELAWDVGTGNGQAAIELARHFAQVIATDASPTQLAHAAPHQRILYRVAVAGEAGMEAASVDLVTVAQAVHWFDRERFWPEVRDALARDGVVAVWCYGLLRVDPAVDAVVDHLYGAILGPWWPPDRTLVVEGYRTLDFPFREIDPPPFFMEAVWTLRELAGYLYTWSAARQYQGHTGENAVALVLPQLAEAWGDPVTQRAIRWPIAVRVGRRPVRWPKHS